MRNPTSVDHATGKGDDALVSSPLGGISEADFLRDHWGRRPLLIRQALPGFAGIVDADGLFRLAAREDVTSRLVIEHPHRRSRWERHDGSPLTASFHELPRDHWTLLVHGVESALAGGWELLDRFSFLSMSRIDDLMVSYAADGGSVGPHDDLYNVFLLQGPGRRRWGIRRKYDPTLDPDAAIKVLKRFTPEEEWLLEPGDMLYLPPGVAHHGIADGPCFTYSIGFLAPSEANLVQSFLGFLGHALPLSEALIEDDDRRPSRDPSQIGDALLRKIAPVLDGIRWSPSLVEEFLGCFLTRPKPQVRFQPPARPLSPEAFARRLRGRGRLRLALPSRGLLRNDLVFLNGEAHRATPKLRRVFGQLVRERSLPLPLSLDAPSLEQLHSWYTAGYFR
jgi:50S ribosomal protein L16 3-hydroxylase